MRRFLVTGANKGIGRAIVDAILAHADDTFVYLGSRDRARGEEAAAGRPRVEVVPLDVADPASVARAREHVTERLYGIVNNAGVGTASGAGLREMLEVNTFGVERVCSAFLPLLEPNGGRIVNVTSASGPIYVAKASEEHRRVLLDPTLGWETLRSFIDGAKVADEDAYGFSKACSNAYTRILAREHPKLRINACTPGFIETDMTRGYAKAQGKPPAALGMKPPEAGAVAPMFLLFGEPEGSGRFYGSDAKRSPLDRYREPGSPPHTGED